MWSSAAASVRSTRRARGWRRARRTAAATSRHDIALSALPQAAAPRKSNAMKAVLTDERFSDPAWIYERKLDGIRCIAIRDGESLRMLSRNDLSLNERYPEVAKTLANLPESRFAIDGEVVAFKGSETSFAKLAEARRTHARVFYYVFDIVWLEGRD